MASETKSSCLAQRATKRRATPQTSLILGGKMAFAADAKGNFNMVTKSLTMIKRWLPSGFLLMRQTDRMPYGSMT